MLLIIRTGSMANIKISVNSIKGIEPGPKDIIVWDTELSGFGFKVTPNGSRSFILAYPRSRRCATAAALSSD